LNSGEQILILQEGRVVFGAVLNGSQIPPTFLLLRDDSILQVTGICTIEVDENRQPIRFRIRLRSPEDVVVVHLPSWWNVQRTLTLIVVMILGIFAALLWVATLRRRVSETTEIIRTTLESTADGILVVDRKGKTVTYNRKFAAMWRIPEKLLSSADDERILKSLSSQLKDPERFLARIQQLYADSTAASDDVLEFVDGRVFERHSEPQLLAGRGIGRVWGFRDVTERRRAEETLVRERTLLRTVIDNLPDQICVKDVSRRIVVANESMARLLSCGSPESLLGKGNFEIYPVHLAGQYETEEKEVIGTGEALMNREEELIDPVQGSRWLLSSKVPLRDGAGQITGSLESAVTSQSVSERNKT
jgi:PAS domain S-box-containing protein